jgi:hypothetical protein
MKREIRIFKSFEEQEKFQEEQMMQTTPIQRFRNLYKMQQLTRTFRPVKNKSRKILILNGRPEQ